MARYVNVTWTDGQHWHTRSLFSLPYGDSKTVSAVELVGFLPDGCIPLLSLSDVELAPVTKQLQSRGAPRASYPAWRATLGLQSERAAKTCYQGEVDPFPAPGSLLTFGQFLQHGPGIKNYLLLLNVESSPASRSEHVEIRNAAAPGKLLAQHSIQNNCINVIEVDLPDWNDETLPVFLCRGMSGIPLFFSCSATGDHLSLEHSHPPASSVIHGQRWEAQRRLKQSWFSKARQE